ncbi:hypothetical protein AB1E22_05275 [Buttiauxella gaviniae]|uniref:Uncharacterized protein n=1 Tax=Buttiauxella gaviniae TaxID=82990 RepID=A0ABV3NRF4_9ENTR
MLVPDKRRWRPNDYIRGREEFNVYPSINPALQDMAMIEGEFITENHFIMLLTPEEARNITDELLSNTSD